MDTVNTGLFLKLLLGPGPEESRYLDPGRSIVMDPLDPLDRQHEGKQTTGSVMKQHKFTEEI